MPPQRDLLRKVLRMKRLLHIYSWAPMAKAMPGGRDLGYTSSWIKMQLRHQMAKKIMDIEVEVLDELDRVLHNSAGIGKRSPLAIWVCLWLLILAYRGHFTFMYWHYFHDKHCMLPRSFIDMELTYHSAEFRIQPYNAYVPELCLNIRCAVQDDHSTDIRLA